MKNYLEKIDRKNSGPLRVMDRAWLVDIGLISQIQRRWKSLPSRLTNSFSNNCWLFYFMANIEAIDSRRLFRILGKFPLKKGQKESILQVPDTKRWKDKRMQGTISSNFTRLFAAISRQDFGLTSG